MQVHYSPKAIPRASGSMIKLFHWLVFIINLLVTVLFKVRNKWIWLRPLTLKNQKRMQEIPELPTDHQLHRSISSGTSFQQLLVENDRKPVSKTSNNSLHHHNHITNPSQPIHNQWIPFLLVYINKFIPHESYSKRREN